MENALSQLVECLQSTLSVLEGPENAHLKAALHDHSKLPDKLLARQAAKAIDLLHRTEQLLEPGPLVLADHFLGYVNTKCLCAAVELDIADTLDRKPQTLAELAHSSNARADRLRQVMRVLHNNGIFSYNEDADVYSNNPTSMLLLRDHWTQWRNWVDLYGSEFYDMARGIPASCRSHANRIPAQINYATEKDMFTYFQEQGWTGRLHRTLSGGAIAQGLGIAEDYPWEELGGTTFLDIGGGGGGLVALALRQHKNLQAGILDLPRVVEQASINFHSPKGEYADVGDRIAKENLIVGNFMLEIPKFECYTMKWCLHDWKDPEVLTILSKIRQSIIKGPRSRLVIFESLLEEGRMGRLSRYADITMMVSANGQERNEKQWRELASESGWQVKEVHSLRNAWPKAIELVPKWESPHQLHQMNGMNHIKGLSTLEDSEVANDSHGGSIDKARTCISAKDGDRSIMSPTESVATDAVKNQHTSSEGMLGSPQTADASKVNGTMTNALDTERVTISLASVNATVDNVTEMKFAATINEKESSQNDNANTHCLPKAQAASRNVSTGNTVDGTTAPVGPERVLTKMTFLEPWDTAAKGNPYYRSAPAEGFDSTNFSWQEQIVTVTDARPSKHSFSLDHHAFQYIDDPRDLGQELIAAIRSGDGESVERLYYPHVEDMIKAQTGAQRIIIFDHTLRKRRPALKAHENPDGKEQPATIVHCDQSEKGALRRLKQNLDESDDYDEILKGRVQMINVWRPISGPVIDWPLAQMDYSSLEPENAHPCDLWRGEFEERGQTMTFEYGSGQKWYYLKEHRVNEVTLIKIWDSKDVPGKCCPHAAFAHPATPPDAPPRESIEVRCLVLYPATIK